jgi:ABC-type Zn uptake system ZnuABC Zn-binding protein ZnuA
MKSLNLLCVLVLLLSNSFITGCENRDSEQTQPEIAVTNSYLQCVVEDLCREQTDVLCLAPPGMCPGHFDISPAQVNQLCKCRILLLFDFQKRLENSLLRIKEKGLKTASVCALPGFCLPKTYLAVCRDVCNILSAEYPDKKTQLQQRLKLIEKHLENISSTLAIKIKRAGVESAKVLSSDHQAEFAEWLGLDVVATFIGSDTETVSNINQCLEKARQNKVTFVIANKQEGTALADALAERLGVKVVVFSNFPDVGNGQNNFDRLLLNNVQALLEAAE